MDDLLPLLKWGMKGDAVKTLQKALVDRGYSVGKAGIDGDFGNDTYYAVRAFQAANGLVVDGAAGEKTLPALGLKWAGKPITAGGEVSSNTWLLWGGVAVATLLIAKKKGWFRRFQ